MGWVQVELLKQQAASAGVEVEVELGTPWRRLEESLGQRQQLVANLLRQIEHHHAAVVDLEAEVQRLNTEMDGLRKTQEALIADLLQRRTIDDDLFWSPYPILGFRVWAIRGEGLFGARVRWAESSLAASCAGRAPLGIPHLEGECSEPPCGIYATKHARRLLSYFDPGVTNVAFGLVALTGRVIEHEHGYRAERAAALALALVAGHRLHLVAQPSEVEETFRLPASEIRQRCRPAASPTESAVEFLEEQRRRYEWTLANP